MNKARRGEGTSKEARDSLRERSLEAWRGRVNKRKGRIGGMTNTRGGVCYRG